MEIDAKLDDAAIDAGFNFAGEEGLAGMFPAAAVFDAVYRLLDASKR